MTLLLFEVSGWIDFECNSVSVSKLGKCGGFRLRQHIFQDNLEFSCKDFHCKTLLKSLANTSFHYIRAIRRTYEKFNKEKFLAQKKFWSIDVKCKTFSLPLWTKIGKFFSTPCKIFSCQFTSKQHMESV